jgi:hypothetical protein
VLLAQLVLLAAQVLLDQQARLGLLELMEPLVLLDQQAQLEVTEQQELLAPLVVDQLEQRDRQEPLVLQGLLALMEPLVQRV